MEFKITKITILFSTILTLTISSCVFVGQPNPDNVTIQILNYGERSAKLLYEEDDKNMPSGKKTTTDYNLGITKNTDTIEIYKGVQFGIEYEIQSPKQKLIELKTVWTYPEEMINQDGKSFDRTEYYINKLTNEYTYSNYTLENNYEMIEGKWNISIFYKSKELLNKNFILKRK